MVDCLSFESLCEIVDLIIIHFKSPSFSDLPLDVFDGLLEPLFANFGTAAKSHSHLELIFVTMKKLLNIIIILSY